MTVEERLSRHNNNHKGFTGKMSEKEFVELEDDIKHNGIKHHVVVAMKRDRNTGDVTVWLGEGNHRLLIASRLNIKKYQLRFKS